MILCIVFRLKTLVYNLGRVLRRVELAPQAEKVAVRHCFNEGRTYVPSRERYVRKILF